MFKMTVRCEGTENPVPPLLYTMMVECMTKFSIPPCMNNPDIIIYCITEEQRKQIETYLQLL